MFTFGFAQETFKSEKRWLETTVWRLADAALSYRPCRRQDSGADEFANLWHWLPRSFNHSHQAARRCRIRACGK